MRKHIYLHTSNFNIINDLNEDDDFEKQYNYDPISFSKLHEYEIGRLKTDQNYYHIVLGNLKQENCPWCGGPAQVCSDFKCKIIQSSSYFIKCMQCGSTGPRLNVSESSEINKQEFEEVIDLLWQRYIRRRPWDDTFVNPYGNLN